MEKSPDVRKLSDVIGKALTKTTIPPYPSILTSLSQIINALNEKDYPQLVAILYEVDVDEDKLKALLRKDKSADPGRIIAAMIIERQDAKVKSRQQFKENSSTNDEEKW